LPPPIIHWEEIRQVAVQEDSQGRALEGRHKVLGCEEVSGSRRILCIGVPGSSPELSVNRLQSVAALSFIPDAAFPEERQAAIADLPQPSDAVAKDDLVWVHSILQAAKELNQSSFDGVWIDREYLPQMGQWAGLLQSSEMLRDMPEGVALLDDHHRVLWANKRLLKWSRKDLSNAAVTFYELLDNPEIMGPDFCPFHTAMATGVESSSTLHSADNRYFQVHAAPIGVNTANDANGMSDADPSSDTQSDTHSDTASDTSGQTYSVSATTPATHLIVTVGDITEEILQQQKIAAIHKAGRELADLRPREIFMMEVDDRIDLLKENIRHYLSDLLNFEVIEIRLLEQATGNLVPLLSVGIDQEAADRKLYAQPRGNGITGYVAASGMSYICQDVVNDPLFIPGVAAAKSSLTVPLILHDQILGTINVESFEPAAFGESDLQFLEIFARDVAFALNTLELLVAQKANTAQQSCDAIHSAVALPVDEILNDAVNVMEGYIGHQSEVVDRLRRILQNARDIKQTIQQIGQKMTPLEAVPAGVAGEQHAALSGKRILVVDEDGSVRDDAHRLLERYGCIVETAHEGKEAVMMVRSSGGEGSYDVIISDIKLPDFSGYQLMCRLSEIMPRVPMVLMTGFGYDPGHSIVKARQAGLHPKGVLFKPFRLDQLIDVVETILEVNRNAATV
jgi:CheY-like chemotaxis protein